MFLCFILVKQISKPYFRTEQEVLLGTVTIFYSFEYNANTWNLLLGGVGMLQYLDLVLKLKQLTMKLWFQQQSKAEKWSINKQTKKT